MSNFKMSDRSRQFELVLYPSENDHDRSVLQFINDNFDYLACVHDRDIDEETGELKKSHCHVIVYFANQRTINGVRELLDVNFAMPVMSLPVRVRYLVHFDHPDKAQYLPTDVFGSMREDIYKYCRCSAQTAKLMRKVLDFIYSSPAYLSFKTLIYWSIDEGLIDYVTKNQFIISKALSEHNSRVSTFHSKK